MRDLLFLHVLVSNKFMVHLNSMWGISSDGRAPALHVGGTGINTQILHALFFFFVSFSFFSPFL